MLQLPVSRAAFLKLPLIQWMPRRGSQAIFYCEAQDLWLLGTWERVNHKTSLTIEVTQDETAWLAENPAWQRQGAPVTLFERAEFGEKLLLPDMSFAVPDEAISVREGTTSKELAPVSITLEEFQELSLHFVGRDVLGTAYVTTGTGVNMTAMWSKDRSHLTLSATSDSHDDWWGYDWPDTTWSFRSSLRDLQESYPVNVTITGVAFNAADLVARNQKRIEIAKRYDGLLPINAFVDVLMTHPTLSEEECLSLAMPVPVTTLHWGENEHSVSRFEILADVWKMYGTISEKQWAAYEARTSLPRFRGRELLMSLPKTTAEVSCTTWADLMKVAKEFQVSIFGKIRSVTGYRWNPDCSITVTGGAATIVCCHPDYDEADYEALDDSEEW